MEKEWPFVDFTAEDFEKRKKEFQHFFELYLKLNEEYMNALKEPFFTKQTHDAFWSFLYRFQGDILTEKRKIERLAEIIAYGEEEE